VNWLWINIPLMAVFFLATAGIPLWLVFKYPDRRPAQDSQALPDSVARSAVPQTAPTANARGARGSDWHALPNLVEARR
jgi:hypothetical protein